jgi:pseudaminic acid biosynthesis-associated methylase
MSFKTEQEQFWAGDFGNQYIERNSSVNYLASNLSFFSQTFRRIRRPTSVVEFGANIGMNLKAIRALYPDIDVHGVEINQTAADKLADDIGRTNVSNVSILDFKPSQEYELALIKGVLIHINPEVLPQVYEKLYAAAGKYILICEYYNPVPVTISYRGHSNRLFKRDFAGEILDKYSDLSLLDYGFVYRRDPSFPQDDITWFLLKKG